MNSTFCTPKKMIPSATPTAASFLFVDQQHHHQGSFNSTISGSSIRTPGSVKRTNRFHLMPMITRTPISRLNRVIVNPFEASLNERLHLPMIGSPSLFHRPATPQMSSTQFEWTIEDVASLGPANVEADETQFVMHTDPEIEARAQEAITSYFRDNLILPSPINCPLREAAAKTRLLPDDPQELQQLEERRASVDELAAANNKSDLKRIKVRDGVCQTVLTFPPKLPKAVEDLLAGFCTYTQEQQQQQEAEEDEEYTSHNDSSNASLRRKLFETSLNSDDAKEETEALERQFQLEHEEQRRLLREVLPMGTPELKLAVKTRTRHFGSPTDNHLELSETKKESFGSLSPILSSNGSTPAQATPAATMQGQHSSSTSSLYRSTPERFSSFQHRRRSMSISSSVEMRSVQGSAMKGVVLDTQGGSMIYWVFLFTNSATMITFQRHYVVVVLSSLLFLLHFLSVDLGQLISRHPVEEEQPSGPLHALGRHLEHGQWRLVVNHLVGHHVRLHF